MFTQQRIWLWAFSSVNNWEIWNDILNGYDGVACDDVPASGSVTENSHQFDFMMQDSIYALFVFTFRLEYM